VGTGGPGWLDSMRMDGAGARVGALGSVWDAVKRTTAKVSTKGSLVMKKVKRKNPLEKSMLINEKLRGGDEFSMAKLEGPPALCASGQPFIFFGEAPRPAASGSVMVGGGLPPLENSC
jgi:hypothetical protein